VAAHVPVRDGLVVTEGDYEIPGVPGRGARIDCEWFEPGGSLNGRLLPTGRVIETVRLRDGRSIDVSIVDAVNPVVFCDGRALGLTGTEMPREIENRPAVLEALEDVRSIGAEILGIVKSRTDATRVSPGLPKVALVAPAAEYKTATGSPLAKDTHDLQGRLMSMQLPHRSYAVSGGICTAVAAEIEGTIVHACAAGSRSPDGRFRIAHPYGIMDVQVEMTERGGAPYVLAARVGRTARRILSGLAYVPASIIPSLTTAGR
jgi:2-methylaconitate cis-trans-isomerase PrpF